MSDDEPPRPEPVNEDGAAKATYGLARAGAPTLHDLDPAILRTPGRAARFPAGARDVPATGGHWFSTGPNNLGGRVTAIAIDPTPARASQRLFAGAASGGVYRSDDGGETWTPTWKAQPSLSIAAIAIAPSSVETIYVASGEPNPAPEVNGAGVFRSDDGGQHWTQIATAEALGRSFFFEAMAVHPSDPGHVWVVGPRGAFRILAANTAAPTIDAFDVEVLGPPFTAAVYYSDVAFGRTAVAPGGSPILYLCRAQTERGEMVRIDAPAAAAAAITTELHHPDNRAFAFAGPGTTPTDPTTLRGKFTICRDEPNVMFAAFAQTTHRRTGDDRDLRGIVRSTTANTGGARGFHNATWARINYRGPDDAGDFAQDGQGEYTLVIAVSPTTSHHLFFGMLNLYVTLDAHLAAPHWHEAINWQPWRYDRSLHADQHVVVFEPHAAATPAVWVGNDGGIVRCDNYPTAAFMQDLVTTTFRTTTRAMLAPTNPLRWRRRIGGMFAAQPYDLTQSPLVPTMYGFGTQDNGGWYTAGGETWRPLVAADGGFIAWDPEDPFHVLATWQGGLGDERFPARWSSTVPALDVQLNQFLWPRELSRGFHRLDAARFVADTVYHPRKVGRIVTTRERRPYATTDGESFTALPVGDIVELVATHRFAQTTPIDHTNPRHDGMVMIELVGGTAAAKLGLFRSLAFDNRNRTRNPFEAEPLPNPTSPPDPLATNIVAVRTWLAEPYALVDGDTLIVQGRCRTRAGDERDVPARTITFHTAGFADITQATAVEVAAAISTALGTVLTLGTRTMTIEARPMFQGASASVELFTKAIGTADPDPALPDPAAPTLELQGDADVLAALRVSPGIYRATLGRPATVTLQATLLDDEPRFGRRERDVAVRAGGQLKIKVNGGGERTLTFASPTFANLGSIRAHELAAALTTALAGDAARAVAVSVGKSLVVARTDHTTAPDAPTSTAHAAFTRGNVPPGFSHLTPEGIETPEHELQFFPRDRFNAFSVPGGALVLRLAGAGGTTDVTFDAAGVVDLDRLTVEEAAAKIRRALPAARHLRCEVRTGVGWGDASEIGYGADGTTLWLGTEGGGVWRSDDDGVHWRAVTDPRMRALDRNVEAVTIDPRAPLTVYVGLGGIGNGANDPGTLWKTTDGGGAWRPIGRAELVEVDGTGAALTPSTPLGINEVVIDPDDSQRLWVATTAGVFESGDGGGSFHPFSEGLPNTEVMDLLFVPGRRLLRCATWGRGTYARDVADPAPPDVQLYLRTSILDDGSVRPADDGLDGFATTPAPTLRWESPDVKVAPLKYLDLGADLAVDGAEPDEQIVSEPIGQHAAAPNDEYTLHVLVHNRSARPATDTRVIALWADCARGVPDLPTTFWPSVITAPTVVDAPWHPLGETVLAGDTTAARPRFARLTFTPPADLATTTDAIGVLVIVTCAADAITTAGPTAIAELLATERRAGFRRVPVRGTVDTETLVLRASDARTFTVTETPAGWVGLATAAVTEKRSNALPRTTDLSAAPVRHVIITAPQPPPSAAAVIDVSFAPDELQRLDVSPAAVTPADLRRVLNTALRAHAVAVRCVADAVQLSARADGRTADLVVRDTAFASIALATAALASGDWLTLRALKRSTTNHLYARLRNLGGAPEPAATWTAFWFDPTGPVTFDAAHQLATGTVALAPGAATVVEITHDPGAAPEATRGVVIILHADRDPARAPLQAPPAGSPPFATVVDLDAYCAANPRVAYRVLELVP